MKKITQLFLVLFSFQFLALNTAHAAFQCTKLFETITVSDRTNTNAENEAAYFVYTINSLTENLVSTPFGNRFQGMSYNYIQNVRNVGSRLIYDGVSYAMLSRLDFVLKDGASNKLAKKIRLLIENEYAITTASGSTDTNFRFFYKLVQLANYPKAQADWIIKNFLENKLKGLGIERAEAVIPLILEVMENPGMESFVKAIQDSKSALLLVTNEPELVLDAYEDPKTQIEDLGLHFLRFEPSGKSDMRTVTLNEKDFQIEVTSKLSGKVELYKRQLRPRLNEMWKDKELLGTILIDTQFTSDGTWLIQEYKDYYKSQGFTFERVRTMSIEEAFIDPFINGKIDYLVTEHSGGLTVRVKPQVLVGTRQTPKGIEKVQIIYSLVENGQVSKIKDYTFDSETELPRLIRLRNSNKVKTELIYINGQCYTACELTDLGNKVDSAYFTYIAPSTLAETFSNSATSPLRELITGLRNGLSYAEIRKRIDKSQAANYRENPDDTNADENAYRLPNEPLKKRADSNYPAAIDQDNKTYSIKLVDDKNKKRPIEFIPLDGAQ